MFKGKPVANSIQDFLGIETGAFPKFLVALAICTYFFDFTQMDKYRTFSQDWIIPVVVRCLLVNWIIAGTWDFLMYSKYSPLFEIMKPYKFNTVYPSGWQIFHDFCFSTCSTLISAGMEIYLLNAWATNKLPLNPVAAAGTPWYADNTTLVWLVSMPFWRLAHFYMVHRMMHPWHWEIFGIDIGAVIYRYVHKLHHKSSNPTSWSGISMHPIESFTYYTASLIPVYFGAHPLVFYYTMQDLSLAALIGHDGFGSMPGGGSQTHWLHHHYGDLNYSENYAPFDNLFGTFAATPEEAEILIAKLRKDRKDTKAK